MDTTNITTTPEALTAAEAYALNRLLDASSNLLQAATDLTKRAQEIVDRTARGEVLAGFASDVLGQPGREVQHHASVRDALIHSGAFGSVAEAYVLQAITPEARPYGGFRFRGGDTLEAIADRRGTNTTAPTHVVETLVHLNVDVPVVATDDDVACDIAADVMRRQYPDAAFVDPVNVKAL